MTVQILSATCPHCDSRDIKKMTNRAYEGTNTWFECLQCKRMWSQPTTDAHRASPVVAAMPKHP